MDRRWWSYPFGVGVAADGKVYVADGLANKVVVLKPDGAADSVLAPPGSARDRSSSPRTLHSTPSCAIYVADASNHRIDVFNPAGDLTQSFGSSGTGPGQFDQTTSLAISQAPSSMNRIFVVDTNTSAANTNNRRVKSLTAWKLPQLDRLLRPHRRPIRQPHSVAVSNTGRVYVTDNLDPTHARVEIFSDAGTFLGSIGQASHSN